MLSYQEPESCQEKQSCEWCHFFLFGENLSEILEDQLVYVWNNFHYMTRNTEMTLRCLSKIIVSIHCEVLKWTIYFILRNIFNISR